MKLSAVVVWYNPASLGKGVAEENILAYSSFVERVYVVDNSCEDNSLLCESIQNAVYIPLGKNRGIAIALNIGCHRALDDGFEWCMTMDQDSQWDVSELALYINKIKEKLSCSSDIKSFAPAIRTSFAHSVLGDVKWWLLHSLGVRGETLPDEEFCDHVFCSGNVINLNSWESLGGFLGELFIDEVDHEFCYKLREEGWQILKLNSVHLDHVLGEPKKTFFPVSNHRGERLYYIFRNMMYVNYLHPDFGKKYRYGKLIIMRVIANVIVTSPSRMLQGLRCLFRARTDFKMMKKRNENMITDGDMWVNLSNDVRSLEIDLPQVHCPY